MMKSLRKMIPWLLLVAGFGLGFVFGAQSFPVAAGSLAQAQEELFQPFWEVWDLLHNEYVEVVDDQALMEAALNGMVDSLGDQHTFYMDPDMFELVNTDLEGEFEGIGATVRRNEDSGGLVIVDTLPNSPAEKAGIRQRDEIVQVDGVDITTMTQAEIIGLIRGPRGTEVQLGVMRPDETSVRLITVVRDLIQIDSVIAEVLENGLVYIQLTQFAGDTASELRSALIELDVEESPGLILDFRGNPGGYLNTSVDVASEFIESGLILKERFRTYDRDYDANGDATAPTVPLVVLVDEGSASASELVAGALQAQDRATIIGTQTFGKGSVQSWHELSNGGGIRVTIARWYTPDDQTVHEVGLAPDIVIENLETEDPSEPVDDLQLEAAIDFLLAPAAVMQP
jgi:carboxyl-terminal processing protease